MTDHSGGHDGNDGRGGHDQDEMGPERGIGGFIRSLLSSIPWSERAEGDETVRLEAPASASIRVDNTNGRTMILGEERDDIVIEVHKTARAESVEAAERLVETMRVMHREDPAGTLEIEVDIPGRWNRKARADLTIHVPRGLRVQVTASNGRICLSGLRAAVRLQSSNGPVRVSDVVGNVEIHTSNAKVHTKCTCGSLTARSSNGKIELSEHRGSVDAATSNGTISCGLEGLGEGGVTLVTSNGRISLELPEDSDADVDIRVDNGLIRTVREIAKTAGDRSGRVKGTLGRGGVPIRLRASNGTISLR